MGQKGTITPGPWNLEREVILKEEERTGSRIGSQIMNKEGWEIGEFFDSEWEGHSPNCQLIATSRELLSELEDVALALRSGGLKKPQQWLDRIGKVIKKAKGE
jgi:hypothetical protein